jgi:hypothetical protein
MVAPFQATDRRARKDLRELSDVRERYGVIVVTVIEVKTAGVVVYPATALYAPTVARRSAVFDPA